MRKHILTTLLLLSLATLAYAQKIYICHNGSYTEKQITDGLEINPSECDSITFDVPHFPAPRVTVSLAKGAGTANVSIPAYAKYITASVTGNDVVITNTQTEGTEPTYVISGSCDNGSVTINGSYKMSVELQSLTLTSSKGAALDIQCGKRVNLILSGTSTLADAAGGAQKACLYCKGHLEVSGDGTLNVSGNAAHAIASKEYLELKQNLGSINIVKAVKDAIHCGQYFEMKGGSITIDENTMGDGIQSEVIYLDGTTKPDTSKEKNGGHIYIKGGSISATIAQEDCKGLKADGDVTISGGTLNINASGNGSRGIQNDGNILIGEETGTTAITISAAGGKCTLSECSDDPHKCTGIKTDGNMTVNAGTITVTNTGKKAKGIKVGGTYTKNGGTVDAVVE